MNVLSPEQRSEIARTGHLAIEGGAYVVIEAEEYERLRSANGFPGVVDDHTEARRALEAELLRGLEGPLVAMTREDWQSIEREALEGLGGESLRP